MPAGGSLASARARCFEVLIAELQLVGFEPFGAAAKLAALQLLHN